ncbi:hypothetical protein FOPE_10150 [Fonsecaea pedrosoi]|nr:hypothetical protein FOPE_10150 [Fonsecaea pedrosoi]
MGLRGVLHDADTMADFLSAKGFDISRCCGEDATYAGIVAAWRRVIEATSSHDTVVIYYAGHGGLVEDSARDSKDVDKVGCAPQQQQPWRYQFLVPIDFRSRRFSEGDGERATGVDVDKDNSFKGLLDVELALLLRATTDRTRNVTVVLDCCHSGRMVRDPSHDDAAVPRNLLGIQHADISNHIARLRARADIRDEARLDVEGNRDAVRIVAAADNETAWECSDETGQRGGVMTKALVKVLQEAWDVNTGGLISWRTALLRIRKLVNVDFPQQNPHVEGPHTRLLFSLEEAATGALVLHADDDGMGTIDAGRVMDVRESNVYALMPHGHERLRGYAQIGKATVTNVAGLRARATLSLFSGKDPIPREGVLAFLIEEALYKWPVAYPEGLVVLQEAIARSKYIRCRNSEDDSSPLSEFRQDQQSLILKTSQGIQLASRQVVDHDPGSWTSASNDLVAQVEQLARAQHLLALTCERPDEKLEHCVAVTFGAVNLGKFGRIIAQDGSGVVTENEPVYISLKNDGATTVYVSIFNVNVAGRISFLSKGSAKGIELPPGRNPYILGFRKCLRGIPVKWPQDIPKVRPINERVILILTDSPVDLRDVASSAPSTLYARRFSGSSSLERLAFHLATGSARDMDCDDDVSVCYDTLHIPFMLRPLTIEDISPSPATLPLGEDVQGSSALPAQELPTPDQLVRGQGHPPRPPYEEPEGRGEIGAIIRATKGIPPYVWVVNEHDEDIQVVVSKYRPGLSLTSGGVSASATGVGLYFECTPYQIPACTKIVPAWANSEDSKVVFPLWTRKEGFGVISIFKGPQKELYIENDRIPLGATAIFSNKPTLKIIDYKGREVQL